MIFAAFLSMTFLGAFGAVSLKKASNSVMGLQTLFTNHWIYLGGFSYVLSAFLNIWLLHRLEYTTVLTMTACTYVWTLLLAKLLFHETISLMKVGAIAMILSGVVIIAI